MRPRESVGVAEGEDEDDDGEARSEGSGPQSLPRSPQAHGAAGALRISTQTRHNSPRQPTHQLINPPNTNTAKNPQTKTPNKLRLNNALTAAQSSINPIANTTRLNTDGLIPIAPDRPA